MRASLIRTLAAWMRRRHDLRRLRRVAEAHRLRAWRIHRTPLQQWLARLRCKFRRLMLRAARERAANQRRRDRIRRERFLPRVGQAPDRTSIRSNWWGYQ